jgi:hypothetical protein
MLVSRSLMDSSLDMRIAKKQIGPDVEAAIGDTSCGRCDPWFPGEDSSTGNVTGGRKLARYVVTVAVANFTRSISVLSSYQSESYSPALLCRERMPFLKMKYLRTNFPSRPANELPQAQRVLSRLSVPDATSVLITS